MQRFERNEKPFATTLRVVGPLLTLGIVLAEAAGSDTMTVGRVIVDMGIAAVILAAWAHQATERWSRLGFLWRYGACCAIALVLGMLCTA